MAGMMLVLTSLLESGDKRERLPGSFTDASSSDDEDDDSSAHVAWEDIRQISIPPLSEPLEVRSSGFAKLKLKLI